MSADKYPSHIFAQNGGYCLYSYFFYILGFKQNVEPFISHRQQFQYRGFARLFQSVVPIFKVKTN